MGGGTVKRAVLIVAALVTLVLATAASCDPGYVKSREWTEDSLGNKTCTLVIQPNDLDKAAFKLDNQHVRRCNKCPKGAKWPDCAKKKDEPTVTTTRTWKIGDD
jgi:predicted Zn-ribbon and HTH transcriptional regulator